MPKILSLIPPQQFEIIRDRLGEILADELASQYALSNETDEALNVGEVWIERIVALDHEETPAVNVLLGRGDYSNKDARQVDGNYVYYIDCYASAPSGAASRGDTLAAIKLQRMMGVCRAVLESPAYRTLGYAPPYNCVIEVSSIAMAQPDNERDAMSQVQGRLEVAVRVPETSILDAGLPLSGNTTTVKLELTNKGYRWIYNAAVGAIAVIDTALLPVSGIVAYAIRLGDTTYTLTGNYANRAALVAYLNGTLQVTRGSAGVFSVNGTTINYTNPEQYTTAEIMAIYKSQMRVYQVGTPDEIVSEFTPVVRSGPITIDALKASITDAQVLAVFIGSQYSEPVMSADSRAYNNINIYILVQQIPA